MRLVIDTSIVFSLFKSNSNTNELLRKHKFELYSPKELIEELKKYSEIICKKSNISQDKFLDNVRNLSNIIHFCTSSKNAQDLARNLIAHESDIPFLSLALDLGIPIWSNDLHFKKQEKIKVFTTDEIIQFLNY
jgi:predicted nucleic acid-binding protein